MPLYLNIKETDANIWIWRIEQSDIELEPEISGYFSTEFSQITSSISKLHFLTTRYMLLKYAGYKSIHKTASGVPKLKADGAELSISHDDEFSAIAISNLRIGIDLQKITPKVSRIKTKFIHPEDSTFFLDELSHFSLIWAAKEAFYKYLQRTGVNFKDEIKIQQVNKSELMAYFLRINDEEKIRLKFTTFENYFLVYTL